MFGEKIKLEKPIINPSSGVEYFDQISSDWYKRDDSKNIQTSTAQKDENNMNMNHYMKMRSALENNNSKKDLTYF